MAYLAHITEQSDEQTVREHAEGTASLASAFAQAFGAASMGYCAGLLHDIGKYSSEFQKRLFGSPEKVDHATAGAQLCWKQPGMAYQMLAYCIAGHHAGLPDTGETVDSGSDKTMCGRMKKKLKDYSAYANEITIPKVKAPEFSPVPGENPGFFSATFIRMLYSCLVDADFLDTEYFMNGRKSIRTQGDSMETLLERLKRHIEPWLKNTDVCSVNGRRTEILKNCMAMGKRSKGLYRLTVPTGGGKTVSSLAFALEHAAYHKMQRIIYVIPYTSIIEQNAKVFGDILGDTNVLENHCNVDYDSSEELKNMQLAAENWDKPVVVTTNVQFFESLFSNKSSKCRKLHNIANSVVIFDEAQMLPSDYLKPCVAIISQLLRYYGCTGVLCTATQPALQEFFPADMQAAELCPRMEEQFRFFKRSSIKNLGVLSEEQLIEQLLNEKQALCILNTKKRTQKIYQQLKGEGVYHLSTTMYPLHRKRILEEIRKNLKSGKKCVVISTSLVEAGVDLDFAAVYRQLAGADSIIQAAGRCNRDGRRNLEESYTYIFTLEGKESVPGQSQQIAVTKSLLTGHKDLEKLEVIHDYFARLYHFRSESLDKKNILEMFQMGDFRFATAAKEFKLIDEKTKTIFIPIEDRAKQILEDIRCKGVTNKLFREAGQYCINVYEQDLDKMQGVMVKPMDEAAQDFFVLTKAEQYTQDMGLDLNIELGQAIMF